MLHLIKKWGFLLASLTTLSTTQLPADFFNTNYPCSDNYSFDECEMCDDFFGKVTFNADILYWTARQQGMDFEISTSTSTNVVDPLTFSQNLTTTTTANRYHFDWRLGYRFGLAYQFSNDGWNFWLNWTHTPGKGHGSKTQAPNLSAHGRWNLTYDSVEGLLRSPYFSTNNFLTWNFVAGLRAARINQRSKSHSEGFTSFPPSPFSTSSISFDRTGLASSNNYRGIGPEVGVNLSYNLWDGISLFGKVNGSLLYSRARQKNYISLNTTSTLFSLVPILQTNSTHLSFKNSNNFWQFVSDYALGLSWTQTVDFFEKDSEFTLNLAWEHSQWFNHRETRTGTYDLSFDGITLSGYLSF